MLTRGPDEVLDWDSDAREPVFLDLEECSLRKPVFEEGTHPGEAKAWDINGSRGDEVVPAIRVSASEACQTG